MHVRSGSGLNSTEVPCVFVQPRCRLNIPSAFQQGEADSGRHGYRVITPHKPLELKGACCIGRSERPGVNKLRNKQTYLQACQKFCTLTILNERSSQTYALILVAVCKFSSHYYTIIGSLTAVVGYYDHRIRQS